MSVGAPHPLIALVRRTRRRLETLRLAKAAARGMLAGAALGLVVLLADRLLPAVDGGPVLPWLLLPAGALLGLVRAATRPGAAVTDEAAALFLDDRLETRQRIVTLLGHPDHPFAGFIAQGVEAAMPRLPIPREIPLVPVALFLLFGAGLLPQARSEGPGTVPAAAAVDSKAAPGLMSDAAGFDEEALRIARERLEAGSPPAPGEQAALREYLERRLHRPEERREAAEALERASRGEAEAIKEVADAVARGEGGRGGREPPGERRRPTTKGAVAPENRNGARDELEAPSAYPEAAELVRAYRRALAQEKR